jgi:CBS domain-containing protein
VTLLPIGGMARLEKMPEKPAQEIAVALAGPAVNVVIWALLVFVFGASTDPAQLAAVESTPGSFLGRVATLNLVLAVFNLLPAFPMDGGRVLRALLSLFMDRVAATRAAATGGQILAFAMGLLGLLSGNAMLVLIAFFIFVAAGAESSDVAMRAVARRLLARDAMITEFEALSPEDSIDTAARTLIRTTQHEFPVVDAAGRLRGFLTRNALFAAMAREERARPVADAMERDIPTAAMGEGLEKVLTLMEGAAPAVAVTGIDGRMVGYITRENIGELMVIANARPQNR